MGNKTCKIAIQLFCRTSTFLLQSKLHILCCSFYRALTISTLGALFIYILHVGHVGAYDNMANLLYKHH